MSVLIETSLGVVVVDLYVKERPKCSLNFLKLLQKNLVAQTGDPTGTGRGGASVFEHLYGEQAKYFDAEKKPKISHGRQGLISMVNNGNGQHGSQFFFTLADNLDYLDQKHTVFGQVAEGMEFIDKINEVYCDKENRPYRNVRIHHTIVLDDPFDTPAGLTFPDSPKRYPISHFGEIGPPRIEEDEELDEAVGLSPKQQMEMKAEQEAKTNAQLLTLIGDLPDPDIKPPDNVLFVCRLNPVTTGEDLEIIFSRFGEIKSCEVIRDKRTGASLQYAFIEFENEKDCENAFFKMDKVIIDDRRIHVDFSQSVAKEWQRYKRDEQGGLASRPPRRRPSPTVENRDDHNIRSESRLKSHSGSPNRPPQRSRRHFEESRASKRKPSPEERVITDRPRDEKHKPLLGADLDLVISESDSNSSDSLAKKKKKHHHRHHRHDSLERKHSHQTKHGHCKHKHKRRSSNDRS